MMDDGYREDDENHDGWLLTGTFSPPPKKHSYYVMSIAFSILNVRSLLRAT